MFPFLYAKFTFNFPHFIENHENRFHAFNLGWNFVVFAAFPLRNAQWPVFWCQMSEDMECTSLSVYKRSVISSHGGQETLMG